MNKLYNGRIDIKTPNTSTLFEMYDKIPANQCSTFRDPTQGLWSETVLSKVYFSKENIRGVNEKSIDAYIPDQRKSKEEHS